MEPEWECRGQRRAPQGSRRRETQIRKIRALKNGKAEVKKGSNQSLSSTEWRAEHKHRLSLETPVCRN